jgi:hypothetical protein
MQINVVFMKPRMPAIAAAMQAKNVVWYWDGKGASLQPGDGMPYRRNAAPLCSLGDTSVWAGNFQAVLARFPYGCEAPQARPVTSGSAGLFDSGLDDTNVGNTLDFQKRNRAQFAEPELSHWKIEKSKG